MLGSLKRKEEKQKRMKIKRKRSKNEQNEMVQKEAHHVNGYGEMVHAERVSVWYATTKERHK